MMTTTEATLSLRSTNLLYAAQQNIKIVYAIVWGMHSTAIFGCCRIALFQKEPFHMDESFKINRNASHAVLLPNYVILMVIVL